MILLQCKKCSHFVELEGAAPKRLRCPSCRSAIDTSSDRVQPWTETVEVGPAPAAGTPRRGGESSFLRPPKKTQEATGPSQRGDVFGNYTILDEISRGAMGVVYRARQVNLNRVVALKLLIAGERASQDQVERFYRETLAVAKLRHPNIIPIYDMGKVGNQHYFTMEYVQGKSLEEIIQQGGVDEEKALDIITQAGRALSHAHEQGIIHRDVKPGNILVDVEGHIQVTDFGLAKEVKTRRNMTHSGVTVGTPHYMSPEQARGASRKVDQRSDVYSLGAVLYELLTGRPPFDGETPVEVVLKVVQDEPVAPRKLGPRISKDLETLCMKALDKDLARRYQSMNEFLADIARYRTGEPIEARSSTLIYSIRKKVNKHKELSTAISAAIIVLSVIFILLEHRASAFKRELSDLREKHLETAKRESKLREEHERDAAQQDKWRMAFNRPFENATMEKWLSRGGTWEPLDSYLIGRATEPSLLEYQESLCGNIRIGFYFMLDAPLTDYFGLGVSCTENREKSGYRFLFKPGNLVLIKEGQVKEEIPLDLQTNRQYRIDVMRENDLLSLRLDDREIISYQDLLPLTGIECSRFRFLLSRSGVSIADLAIELESIPLRGSPFLMADRHFMEGRYQRAIEDYRCVAKMPPDAETAAEALYKMGLAYIKLDSLTEAVECFEQVVSLYEDSRQSKMAALQLGLAYLKSGDHSSLNRLLEERGPADFVEKVVREAPLGAIESYVAQLELPEDGVDSDASVKRLKEFILLNSYLPEGRRDRRKLAFAHTELAAGLYERKEYPEATKVCREVIASYSDQFDAPLQARYLLGHINMAVADYPAAVTDFEEWLEIYPAENFARRVVRNATRRNGRIERVLVSDRGWKLFSDYVGRRREVQRALAIAYVELGRFDDSLAIADSIIEKLQMGAQGRTVETHLLARADLLRRDEHWANFWKGCILTIQGAYHKALACFDRAYRPVAAEGAGRPFRERATDEERQSGLGQTEHAFDTDEEAPDDNTRVDIMRYIVHLKLGNRAGAVKCLETTLASNPTFFGPATPGLPAVFALDNLPQEIPSAVPKNKAAYSYLAGVTLFAANRRDKARAFLALAAGSESWWPYYLARSELAALDAGGSF